MYNCNCACVFSCNCLPLSYITCNFVTSLWNVYLQFLVCNIEMFVSSRDFFLTTSVLLCLLACVLALYKMLLLITAGLLSIYGAGLSCLISLDHVIGSADLECVLGFH